VIDDWGRTPLPYAADDGTTIFPPAYQQVLKGLPAVNYSARDIIYRPRNVRAHKVYGYSPVQQVLMTVNIGLRRQLWQLDYFSEGSIPDALIGVPASWTPEQIKQFQDYRRRSRPAPPRQIRAGRQRAYGASDQGAAAQGRLRRMARPHRLLRLLGAAAMGGKTNEPRDRRQPVGAERGGRPRAHQGMGQGPRRRDHRRGICLA
jgi:hypothetical protein